MREVPRRTVVARRRSAPSARRAYPRRCGLVPAVGGDHKPRGARLARGQGRVDSDERPPRASASAPHLPRSAGAVVVEVVHDAEGEHEVETTKVVVEPGRVAHAELGAVAIAPAAPARRTARSRRPRRNGVAEVAHKFTRPTAEVEHRVPGNGLTCSRTSAARLPRRPRAATTTRKTKGARERYEGLSSTPRPTRGSAGPSDYVVDLGSVIQSRAAGGRASRSRRGHRGAHRPSGHKRRPAGD